MHPSIAAHLRSGNVSRIVYGSIIGLALVLTLEAHRSQPAVAIGTLLATAVAVGLAELYSELLEARTRGGMGAHVETFESSLGVALAVAFGIAFPCVFFAAAGLDLIEPGTAFTVAKWTGLGLIGSYGYVAGRLSGAGAFKALLQAAAVGLIAAVLIALKALLH